MIWYNARVTVRSLLLAASLFSPAIALAQPNPEPEPPPIVLTTNYSGNWFTTTDGMPTMLVSSAGLVWLSTNGTWVLDTSGAAVTGTSGSMLPGMKPGVPGKPAEKHPYFFAAYLAVWLGLFAYVAWLASRLRSLDEKP